MSTPNGSGATGARNVPGIVYSPLTGRARVQGSGLEVFEIIQTWQAVSEDWGRLSAAYYWLTPEQLRAALAFYEQNRDLVDARLARERERSVEEVWERYPESRPPRR